MQVGVVGYDILRERKGERALEDIFGFLTSQEWLALLRTAVELWWVKSVLHKPLREFVSG